MSKAPLDQGQYDTLETIERRMREQGDPLEQLFERQLHKFRDRVFQDHLRMVAQTQSGILQYAEPMAQVLAEAAMASHKATGDSPYTALFKWNKVITNRAQELLRARIIQEGKATRKAPQGLPPPADNL